MKKILSVLFFTFLTTTVYAEQTPESIPFWFPLLEVAGIIIGVIVSALTIKVYIGMEGGQIGSAFGKILLGVISITFGIAINGLNETFELLSEFSAEVAFELFIYIGMVFIGIGSYKVAKLA